MKPLSNKNLARGFDQFIFESYEQFLPIFEASFLNQLGLPQSMIKKIHRKKEHISDKYPRTGHMYQRGTPLSMPYKYYQPAAELPLPEPIKLTGAYSYSSPFEDRENERSAYKDIAWYLISLRSGQPLRVLMTDEDKSAFFYIYNKSLSAKNIPGDQFGMVISFKDDTGEWKTVDIGFGESVTFGAGLNLIGSRHAAKGGNRTDKVMELIKSLTGGPSKKNPILVYNLEIMQPGQMEPRELRKSRFERGMIGSKSGIELIQNFATKYTPYLLSSERLASRFMNTMENTLDVISGGNPIKVPAEVSEMASSLGINANQLFVFLFFKMRNFRQDLLEEGKGGYRQTPGEDLEEENSYLTGTRYGLSDVKYKVEIEMLDPDEVAGARRGEQYVESKPENAVAVPQPGDYASVESMIKSDSLMGVLGNFMNYIITNQIRNIDPDAAIAKLMGMSAAEYRRFGMGEEDIEY
jgi:hypothetical protein